MMELYEKTQQPRDSEQREQGHDTSDTLPNEKQLEEIVHPRWNYEVNVCEMEEHSSYIIQIVFLTL